MALTLLSRHNPLASTDRQREVLTETRACLPFEERLTTAGLAPLRATGITVFQINVGKLCNQTCRHCHVDAGPDREERMSRETAELCIRALAQTDIPTVDITGGAPELNPNFRWLVEQATALGRHIIDRCNLSVLLLPSQTDLVSFLAERKVEIIASLPYFRPLQTNAQRGDGVHEKSIEALQLLNRVGYGQEGSGLTLNLVHNPVGAFLPPKQGAIEAQFRHELAASPWHPLQSSLYYYQHADQPLFWNSCLKAAIMTAIWNAWPMRSIRQRPSASCAGTHFQSAGTAACTIATSIRCWICR